MHGFSHNYQMALYFNLEKEWPSSHYYDFGVWENCKRMLGDDWYFWIIPTNPQLTDDGHSYKINPEMAERMRNFSLKLVAKKQESWDGARGAYVIPVKSRK